MPKHILVATDLSPRADRAVFRAVRLAREHHARLTFVHVQDDALPDDLLLTRQADATRQLDRFAAHVADGLTYTTLPLIGTPSEVLLDTIDDLSPDLLVLGLHRPRAVLDEWRETTAQRVTRMTDCPVLLVRDPDDHAYATTVAATDFSPAATAALNLGHSLAPKATLTPVHALHIPYDGLLGAGGAVAMASNSISQTFRAEAQHADAEWRATHALPVTLGHTLFPEAGPMLAISNAITETDAHLVTVGAHGRPGAHRSFLGSLATDLMRDPPCDVLIARPAD